MPSPTTASNYTPLSRSGVLIVDALLGGSKWGAAVGTGASLTYSFPWANGGTATFRGLGDVGNYSKTQEQTAQQRYAFNATEQNAARSALEAWAAVANITFTQSADNASTVGDLRYAWIFCSMWKWRHLMTPSYRSLR